MTKLGLRILRKLGWLNHFNLESTIFLNGHDFTIPILETVGFDLLFMSEPWMIDVLTQVIQVDEDPQFLDVGVNIGQTLLKLRSVSNRIDYIGFEPNPMCVNYVHRLIQANDITHTSIMPVGISNRTGIAALHFFDATDTDSSASIIEDVRPTQKVFKKDYISVSQWDQIKNQLRLSANSILKIDVEGAELEVLQTMTTYIENYKPIILLEILPVYSLENSSRLQRQSEIEHLIEKLQYTIHRVRKSNNAFDGFELLTSFGIHGDLNACDYVLVPKSKLSKFNSILA